MKLIKPTKFSKITLPVLIEQDEDGVFVGSVPSLRSCYTQGETLDELYKNLKEVVTLCLEVESSRFKKSLRSNKIIGFQNIEFAI
jgi:predicted RNase H-like HicB family nuclease